MKKWVFIIALILSYSTWGYARWTIERKQKKKRPNISSLIKKATLIHKGRARPYSCKLSVKKAAVLKRWGRYKEADWVLEGSLCGLKCKNEGELILKIAEVKEEAGDILSFTELCGKGFIPETEKGVVAYIRTLLKWGNVNEALKVVDSLIKQGKIGESGLLGIVDDLLNMGYTTHAMKLINKATGVFKDRPEVLLKAAQIELSLKRYYRARQLLWKILKLKGGNVRMKKRVLYLLSQARESPYKLEKLYDEFGKGHDTLLIVSWLRGELCCGDKKKVHEIINRLKGPVDEGMGLSIVMLLMKKQMYKEALQVILRIKNPSVRTVVEGLEAAVKGNLDGGRLLDPLVKGVRRMLKGCPDKEVIDKVLRYTKKLGIEREFVKRVDNELLNVVVDKKIKGNRLVDVCSKRNFCIMCRDLIWQRGDAIDTLKYLFRVKWQDNWSRYGMAWDIAKKSGYIELYMDYLKRQRQDSSRDYWLGRAYLFEGKRERSRAIVYRLIDKIKRGIIQDGYRISSILRLAGETLGCNHLKRIAFFVLNTPFSTKAEVSAAHVVMKCRDRLTKRELKELGRILARYVDTTPFMYCSAVDMGKQLPRMACGKIADNLFINGHGCMDRALEFLVNTKDCKRKCTVFMKCVLANQDESVDCMRAAMLSDCPGVFELVRGFASKWYGTKRLLSEIYLINQWVKGLQVDKKELLKLSYAKTIPYLFIAAGLKKDKKFLTDIAVKMVQRNWGNLELFSYYQLGKVLAGEKPRILPDVNTPAGLLGYVLLKGDVPESVIPSLWDLRDRIKRTKDKKNFIIKMLHKFLEQLNIQKDPDQILMKIKV